MSTRLSAPDRRRQILEIASGIFARKGYQGATTREIAEEAGVNEALLFRHFPSKESLYWTMLEELCLAKGGHDRLKKILKEAEAQAGAESDLEVFQAIAREILERSARDRALTRLLWFTALENHELSVRFFKTFVAEYYEALAGYIRTRIRQGIFRRVDPLLAARGFLGMVVYHFQVQEFFGGEQYRSFDTDEVAATLAGIWLAGMLRRPAGVREAKADRESAAEILSESRRILRRPAGVREAKAKREPAAEILSESRRILRRPAGVREAKAKREPAAEILSKAEGSVNGRNGHSLSREWPRKSASQKPVMTGIGVNRK